MEKELLETLINKGLSTRQISKEVGKGQTTVRHWMKKYDLKTNHNVFAEKEYGEYRYCTHCKKDCLTTDFYQRRGKLNSSVYCRTCTTIHTTSRMREFKIKCVEYKGGSCIECGYNKYYGALEFHHIDPMLKDFEISKVKGKSFNESVKTELDKCVLLCNRCHREVEGGVIILTEEQKGM